MKFSSEEKINPQELAQLVEASTQGWSKKRELVRYQRFE